MSGPKIMKVTPQKHRIERIVINDKEEESIDDEKLLEFVWFRSVLNDRSRLWIERHIRLKIGEKEIFSRSEDRSNDKYRRVEFLSPTD